jgi:hypothetical protein
LKTFCYEAKFDDIYSSRAFVKAIQSTTGIEGPSRIKVAFENPDDMKLVKLYVPVSSKQSSLLLGQLDAYGGQLDLCSITVQED